MNLVKLQSLLPRQIKDLHLKAEVDGAQVCKLWHEYAGQCFLSRTMENHEAINFRDGVLTILTNNPEITEEIQTQKHRIISRINHALGKNVVISVRFRS